MNEIISKPFLLLLSLKKAFKKCAGCLVTLDFITLFFFNTVSSLDFSLPEGSMAYLYFIQHQTFLLLSLFIHIATNAEIRWETLRSSQRNYPKSM